MTEDGLEPIPVDFSEDEFTQESVIEAKRCMRSTIKGKVAAFAPEERVAASAAIRDSIGEMTEFADARSVAGYWAMADEVDLNELLEKAISTGRDVVLPVTDTKKRTMRFVSVEDPLRDLAEGAYGILEPRRGMPLSDASNLDVILVPGRAFDRTGARLGRGGGYYDGFLSGFKPHEMGGPLKVGVAFGCQMVERVPELIRDVKVDRVVTERGVITPERK